MAFLLWQTPTVGLCSKHLDGLPHRTHQPTAHINSIMERDTIMTLDALLFVAGSWLGFTAILGAALSLLTMRGR